VTIDATFKRTRSADFVSMQAWGRRGWNEHYLGDEVHERLSYVELRQATRDFIRKHSPQVILIEEKANGAALVDELSREFPGVLPWVPDRYGDKVSRAQVVTVYWAAGNIWLPADEPWIGDWIAEVCAFPAAAFDDRVDAMVQYLIWCQEQSKTARHDAHAAALQQVIDRMG